MTRRVAAGRPRDDGAGEQVLASRARLSSASLRASWSVRVLSSDCRSALTSRREVLRLRVESRNEASKRVSVCLALSAKIAASRSVAFLRGAIVRIGRQRLRVRGPRRRGVAPVLGVEARRIRRPGRRTTAVAFARSLLLSADASFTLEGRDQHVGDVLLEREELVLLALDPLARQHGARLDVEDARVDADRVARPACSRRSG